MMVVPGGGKAVFWPSKRGKARLATYLTGFVVLYPKKYKEKETLERLRI